MTRSVLIIGGGPAGYVAALRAAALGGTVTLVERDALGGTCLNRGCIPTKALLEGVHTLQVVRHAGRFGVKTGESSVDYPAFFKRKETVVATLRTGVTGLLNRAGIRVISGTGQLVSSRKALVTQGGGTATEVSADAIIVATGSAPANLPITGMGPDILTSDTALQLTTVPQRLIIVGAGVIGLEFATIFHGLGARVTIIEAMPRVAPTEDEAVSAALASELTGRGIEILCDSRLGAIDRNDSGYRLSLTVKGVPREVAADQVLMAVGRKPVTADLGLAAAGVAVDARGFIQVNERMETSSPGVYAAGDVVGGPLLAHIAYQEGTVAAENAMGASGVMRYKVVPRCIFSDPEAAAVGLSEAEAVAAGYRVKVGHFAFAGSGKALAMGERTGFVKVVSEEQFGEVLGVHIVGSHATDLIGEAVLALHMEATAEELAAVVHAHPTLTEALKEAAMDALGTAIHK